MFISSNVNANAVGSKLRDVVQTRVDGQALSVDDMRMTGTVAEVDYGKVTSASICHQPAHPLAGGQNGTVAMTTANHGSPSGSPARVQRRWPPPPAR